MEEIRQEIKGVIIKPLTSHQDSRGNLIEIYRQDEDPISPVMSYISFTKKGVTRGPHEHKQQSDYFSFAALGDFILYLWDNRKSSPTYKNRMRIIAGDTYPCSVIIPPGVVHAYKAVSEPGSYCINLPDTLFKGQGKKAEVDEIRHEDDPDSRFKLD